MGILCSRMGYRGRNAPSFSRYYLLQNRFSAILVPIGPWDNSEMCVSRAVSSQKTLESDGFLTPTITDEPCQWTNTVCEAGIELSCVEIGQKLISVDRKVSTTIVMTIPILWLRISIIFIITVTCLTTDVCLQIFGSFLSSCTSDYSNICIRRYQISSTNPVTWTVTESLWYIHISSYSVIYNNKS